MLLVKQLFKELLLLLLANKLVEIRSCPNGTYGAGDDEGSGHQENLQQPEPERGGLLQDSTRGGGGGFSAEG